jgi:putative oligomerization/nucleic acid binding protein
MGPGLIGTMARTAIVAGTASAVAGGVSRHQQAKAEATAQGQAAQQAPPPAPAGTGEDFMAKLRQLAELNAAGVLSAEEFTAAKAKLLA